MQPTLFFLDGAVVAPGRVALAAQYNEYADADASRVLLMLEDGWVKIDFDEDVIRSMSFAAATGTLYMLGKSGLIYSIGGRNLLFTRASIKGTRRQHQVVDPEDRGELLRVRAFGERVLACGLGGQLMELRSGVWQSIGLGEPTLNCPDFEDVAVEASGSVLAVGSNGTIYRFEESGAVPLDSPTNQHLSSITRDVHGCHFVCGNNGVVLSIDGYLIKEISVDLPPVRNLWAIEHHEGGLYIVEPARLLMHDGTAWRVEHVSTNPVPTFYRLASVGEELWSFGADHVFVKRGATWTQLSIPGNEIAP